MSVANSTTNSSATNPRAAYEQMLAQQVGDPLKPYIGVRDSSVKPGTAEFFNAQNPGQVFGNPNDLYSYASSLGFGPINSFQQIASGSLAKANPTLASVSNTPQPVAPPATLPSNGVSNQESYVRQLANQYYNSLVPPSNNSARGAYEQYLASLNPTQGELVAKGNLDSIYGSRDAGLAQTRAQIIPMRYITGQSQNIAEQANAQAGIQERVLQREQEARGVNADIARSRFEYEKSLADRDYEASVRKTEAQLNFEKSLLENMKEDERYKQGITREDERYNRDIAREDLRDKQQRQNTALEFGLKYPLPSGKSYYNINGTAVRASDLTPVDLSTYQRETGQSVGAPAAQTNFSFMAPVTTTPDDERALVLDMASKYLDSEILPSDNYQTALAKLQNSKTYQNSVRLLASGGSSGGGRTTSTPSASKKTVTLATAKKYGLSTNTPQQTYTDVVNGINEAKRSLQGQPYYEMWGKVVDWMRANNINPQEYDSVLWEMLHPDGLAGRNKSGGA